MHMNSAKANRSCGTCRDRRVACDRQLPACNHCVRAGRECKGYGLRLSWPSTANDGRRAVLANVPPQKSTKRHPTRATHLVRVSMQDIELHYDLQSSRALSPALLARRHRMLLPMPMSTAKPSNEEEWHLLSYFRDVASRTLSTASPCGEHDLGLALSRIGLKDDSPSSQAVLRALLAVSSLHRYGLTERAFELKVSSIGALAAASKPGALNGPEQIIQHVAAGMLLCSFEVHRASCTSEQWLIYILGIKRMLDATPELAASLRRDPDWVNMITWVLYHYTLARFTLRYWRHDEVAGLSEPIKTPFEPNGAVSVPSYVTLFGARQTQSMVRSFAPWPMQCLDWMTDIADLIDDRALFPSLGAFGKERYKARVRQVDSNIRETIYDKVYSDDLNASDVNNSDDYLGICQLAVLIYLDRATKGLLGEPARTDRDVAASFRVLGHMERCDRHFFLFVVACEARSDEQRALVLDVMDRTEAKGFTRPLNHVRLLIEAVWAQDDLFVPGQRRVDYWDKMSTVMSIATIPPSFV